MSDEVWKRREIASPCIRLCLIHPEAKICTGCYRTGDEIAGWMRMTDDERAALMAELPSRADRLKVRRGGRRGRAERQGSDSQPGKSASGRK